MYPTCRHIKHIARFNGASLQNIRKRTIIHSFLIFFRSNLLCKTGNQLGTLVSSNNIPHFIFTKTVMTFLSQLVTRVYLNRQVQLGINKLYQQRKLISETCIVGFSYQVFLIFSDHIRQRQSFVCTIGHYRLTAFYCRHFPTLAYIGKGIIQMFEWNNLVASPKRLLQNRLKF